MTHDQYLSRKQIPSLDGLRAISVLLVVTVHLHIGNWTWLAGARGVTIFFILSGYLITFLALKEERERGYLNLGAFYIRRIFRIFPLYYLIVAVYVFLIFGMHIRPDKASNFSAALPYLLTYLQEVPFFYGVNGATENIPLYQSWSLGIEEKFYLIWPVVAFVLLKNSRAYRLPACIIMLAICLGAAKFLSFGSMIFPYFHILIGCAIALFLDNEKCFRFMQQMNNAACCTVIVTALLAVHFLSPWLTFFSFEQDILYSVLGGVLVAGVLTSGAISDRYIGRSSLVFVGRLSYAIYLVHVLCLNVSETAISKAFANLPLPVVIPALLNLLITVAASILVSLVLARTVERPLVKVGHRISEAMLGKDRSFGVHQTA